MDDNKTLAKNWFEALQDLNIEHFLEYTLNTRGKILIKFGLII